MPVDAAEGDEEIGIGHVDGELAEVLSERAQVGIRRDRFYGKVKR